MKYCRMGSRFALCIFCAALGSCASVSLKKVEVLTANPPLTAPTQILVKPPTFYEPGLRVDRSGARLETFKHDMQERFTRTLVRRLSRFVAPAQAVAATAPLPHGNRWLIMSRYDKVNQGPIVAFLYRLARRSKARNERGGL